MNYDQRRFDMLLDTSSIDGNCKRADQLRMYKKSENVPESCCGKTLLPDSSFNIKAPIIAQLLSASFRESPHGSQA